MELQGLSLLIAGVVITILVPTIAVLLRHGYKVLEIKLDQAAEGKKIFEMESFVRLFGNFKSELRGVVEDAVDALDQIYVQEWKAKSADGKLSKEEIAELNQMLIDYTNNTLSNRAREFLESSVPNLSDLILELGEAYIGFKREQSAEDGAGN